MEMGIFDLLILVLQNVKNIRYFVIQFNLVLENGKKTIGICGSPNYMAPEIIMGFICKI